MSSNTRRFLLSEANPFYFKGDKAAGIGSPHTPSNYIWHIAMAIQGLTSETREEKLEILKNMAATTGGKGVMHEGFCCEDDSKFTRAWFSWQMPCMRNYFWIIWDINWKIGNFAEHRICTLNIEKGKLRYHHRLGTM